MKVFFIFLHLRFSSSPFCWLIFYNYLHAVRQRATPDNDDDDNDDAAGDDNNDDAAGDDWCRPE